MKILIVAVLALSAVTSSPSAAPTMVDLGPVAIEKIKDAKAQRHFALEVPIQHRGAKPIDITNLMIQVAFYDLVNGKLQPTTADMNSRWKTPPADWRASDTEVLEVEFNQPAPERPDARPEKRTYFGYIVRVYYRNELQAAHAEPPVLGKKFPAAKAFPAPPAPKKTAAR
ncbi:MAG: hypothetical protein ABJF10_09760 [Chthoniobacter sp.]|uniref:hypothetical protein n=1 Tax=Chthoniobacter sp. TaxID=2510640 RepID=UPI0032A7F7E0